MSPLNLASLCVLSILFFVSFARCELGLMQIILEGMREKCFIEELPPKTVILVKHEASLIDTTTMQPVTHIPLNLLVTVRDPQGHSVIRQQGKPNNKIFMTSSLEGEYSVCFQAMPTQFTPNLGTLLGLEIFIGDNHDTRITAPIEVQLHDLSAEIADNNQLIAEIKKEQTLQRKREKEFRKNSESLLSSTFWYGAIQVIVLAGVVAFQIQNLSRFFLYKKIV